MSPSDSMPYKILIFYTLITFCTWLAQGEPGKCRDGITKNITPHQLLRQDLFCSYDKESRPVIDFHKNVTVDLKLFVKFFVFDEHKNVLEVHAWLAMSWTDEGLKWNPPDYSNINVLHVKDYDIWMPDISIYNSGNMETNGAWDYTHCVVYSTGIVLCVPTLKWSAQCKANLQQWPFDQQNCTMTIGSWSQSGEQLDINLKDQGIGLEDFASNREWELLKSSAKKEVTKYSSAPNSTYQSIDFHFHIKRHADAYAATVIIPSLAIALLTLGSYWLDPNKSNRLAACCISTLCHCLYLQYLGLKLPVNGTMTPIIILLYRDSLIITSMALVLAVVVERMSSSSNDTSATSAAIPAWLDRFVGVVLDHKAVQLLLLGKFDSKRGDGTSLMENGTQSNEGKQNKDWFILVTIINRLGFLVSLITYFILYIALIPKY
ncbi:hypothetical protein J437_LFUL015345 [Ladona fulva]|uniref:Neurotransmitter-gated ion-channel ligand-binding domain-containing protein n=1 Tax=Ladona fulva TaxID=123851 RepID=A0A8K0KGC6_LADFU|nr:hypothetical protein J437_LFUL015345 [Ladona fulva]